MQIKCHKCLKDLDTSFFSKNNNSSRGYHYKCKPCHNKYVREIWYTKNQKKQVKASENYKRTHRFEILSTKYNIPIDEVRDKFLKSNGLCVICKREKKLVLDHCHRTNKIRGFICNKCNTALGMIEDNIQTAKNIVKYLK